MSGGREMSTAERRARHFHAQLAAAKGTKRRLMVAVNYVHAAASDLPAEDVELLIQELFRKAQEIGGQR